MPTAATIAVIDLGSNSIKLLVARPGAAPCLIETVFQQTVETRIAKGLGGDPPQLTRHAISVGTETVCTLLDAAAPFRPDHVAIVATSAVRDAGNRQDLIDSIRERSGHRLRLLSGMDEARLIGLGLGCDPAVPKAPRFFQIDLGGGSLELIRFTDGCPDEARSLPLGAVRLTERCIADPEAPVPPAAEARIREAVRTELRRAAFSFAPSEAPLIATGGAFAVARNMLAAQRDPPDTKSDSRIERSRVATLGSTLATLPLAERLQMPGLPPARADIAPAAFCIIDETLAFSQREGVVHSFYNLRYGIAREWFAAGAAPAPGADV